VRAHSVVCVRRYRPLALPAPALASVLARRPGGLELREAGQRETGGCREGARTPLPGAGGGPTAHVGPPPELGGQATMKISKPLGVWASPVRSPDETTPGRCPGALAPLQYGIQLVAQIRDHVHDSDAGVGLGLPDSNRSARGVQLRAPRLATPTRRVGHTTHPLCADLDDSDGTRGGLEAMGAVEEDGPRRER
jgi:hypothetical protein